ncbi:MAG TPA: PA2779 family protein [Burkholderiales bacterium]|nr:PA2779 family protein [Burkholderiales bacterium]
MQSAALRNIARLLLVTFTLFSLQAARAEMIGTERLLAPVSAQAARDTLAGLAERADVATQLQALGLDATLARERVAALTDDEVHALYGKVEALPAGGDGTAIAVLLIVLALIYYKLTR